MSGRLHWISVPQAILRCRAYWKVTETTATGHEKSGGRHEIHSPSTIPPCPDRRKVMEKVNGLGRSGRRHGVSALATGLRYRPY